MEPEKIAGARDKRFEGQEAGKSHGWGAWGGSGSFWELLGASGSFWELLGASGSLGKLEYINIRGTGSQEQKGTAK